MQIVSTTSADMTPTLPTEYPCVTAVVNTYHRAPLLRRALASVLAQTYHDYELIVVHDGPIDDATGRVISEYVPLFDAQGIEIWPYGLEENSGYQCVPKNHAIERAAGDYIAFLDDDNEWTADHLQVLVAAMEEGDVWPDFVYGRREYVRDENAPEAINGELLPVGPSSFQPFNEEALRRLAASPLHNFIDTSDALITKGAFWMLGMQTGCMWNPDYRRFGDWELFARATHFAGWRGKAVDRVVQRYHWTGENLQLTRPANETPVQKRG